MAEPFAVAGADYLEDLLRAAIQAPAAAADPSSGRVVARLMVALGARREDERLGAYLSCRPGRPSVYEVTSYDEANRPASRISDLAAGPAIRAAVGFAAARPDCAVVVAARDVSGYERCVLVARGLIATYHFPEVAEPSPPAQEAEPSPLDEVSSSHPRGPGEAEQWAALTTRLEALPTAEEVGDELRAAMAGMTTDLRERLSALSTTEEVVTAIRDLLAGMTIELDATAIEDVIHTALDELPHVVPVPPPASTEVSELDDLGAAAVADVPGHGSVSNVEEPAPLPTGPVGYRARINAMSVADQVADIPPEEPSRVAHRGSRQPSAVSVRVTSRSLSDRPVDDVPALGALASRR